jgi:hypothetical protein
VAASALRKSRRVVMTWIPPYLPSWSAPTTAPSQAKCKLAAGHVFTISQHRVPESCRGSPSKPEGAVRSPGGTQGMPGCALHPRSRAPMCAKKMRTRAYRFSGGIRHSLRNGLTAYATLSSATNSSCHRRRRIEVACSTRSGQSSPPPTWHQQRVSGPHGFAVRSNAARPARPRSLTRFNPPCDRPGAPTLSRPPHPVPRS